MKAPAVGSGVRRALVGLLVGTAAAGCGEPAPPRESAPPELVVADTTTPPGSSLTDPVERAGNGSARRDSAADIPRIAERVAGEPFASFGILDPSLAEATSVRKILVEVVNRGEHPIEVLAEAGAGAVVVDTVSASDSMRAELRVRADSVRIWVRDSLGDVLDGGRWLQAGAAGRLVFP